MEQFKITKESTELYKSILQYIYRIHRKLETDEQVEISYGYDLAKHTLGYMRQSNSLNYFAINYFDKHDISISHAANVAILAATIGIGLKLDEDKLINLLWSGFIHDMGAVKVTNNIINKLPSEITESDRKKFEAHSKLGFNAVIKNSSENKKIAEIIFEHHERCDGSGYPRHKTKDKLNIESCIISLIDVYEALIHPREMRDTLVPPKGISEIVKNEVKSFDPKLMKSLLEEISIYPIGSFVKLNSGEMGRVVKTHPKSPLRPDILVYYNNEKVKVKPYIIELSNEYIFKIIECLPSPEFEKVTA